MKKKMRTSNSMALPSPSETAQPMGEMPPDPAVMEAMMAKQSNPNLRDMGHKKTLRKEKSSRGARFCKG